VDYLNDNPLLKQIFSFVRLSPSGANIQPWRFILSDEKIYCFAHDISKENPLLNENLWGMDFSRFDAGIAMCHFDIAAKGLGYKGGWQIPSGDNDKKEQGNSKSGNRLVGIWE
jgi:nitroreductase